MCRRRPTRWALHPAISSLTMAAGKRLRPAFLLGGHLGGGGAADDDAALHAAAAVELLRTFTGSRRCDGPVRDAPGGGPPPTANGFHSQEVSAALAIEFTSRVARTSHRRKCLRHILGR